MGKKTIWAICAINVLASAGAIAWVTRPYWQPRSKPPTLELPKAAAKDAEISWMEFAGAETYDAARFTLAEMPADAQRQARLGRFLGAGEARPETATADSTAMAARRAAALAFWGEGIESGGADDLWLRELALDRGRTALEREAALRAVMLAAQRRHKAAPEDEAGAWRGALVGYLEQSDFGRGSSVEGLALQARAFALAEKIAPIDRSALVERIGLLLLPENGAGEAVTISALEVARGIAARELLGVVRIVARQPRSDACQQAALGFLAELGTEEDLSWLDGYTPSSGSLQLAASDVRARLAARLAARTAGVSAPAVTPP